MKNGRLSGKKKILLESGRVTVSGVNLDAEDDGGLFGGEHDPCGGKRCGGGENPKGNLGKEEEFVSFEGWEVEGFLICCCSRHCCSFEGFLSLLLSLVCVYM